MNKIATIIRKEWAEVFKNRMVLFTIAFMPLMLHRHPAGDPVFDARDGPDRQRRRRRCPAQFARAARPVELNGGECFQVFMVSQFVLMFMIIPLIDPGDDCGLLDRGRKDHPQPGAAAGYTDHHGGASGAKSLAAVVPAVLATWRFASSR